jgi:glycosyltransferase involved in cell wall biosynthesis
MPSTNPVPLDDRPPAGSPVPRVSVVIPTYNRAALVTQAIDSVLAQTLTAIELIVVDDGSTDPTREALAPYAGRIRYVRRTNGGAAAARNSGIAAARGELLAFLDSDDLFEPRMLEAALCTFERYPQAGGVCTAERDLDARGVPGTRVHSKRSPGPYFTPAGMLRTDTRVGAGRPAVVRRECVARLGGFDESMRCAIDCEMWIRYAFHVPLVLQPEPLVLRRFHPDNLSDNRLLDAEDWIRILHRLAAAQPDFVRRHGATWRRCLARNTLRRGRELLARGAEPTALAAARASLREACRLRPALPRGWIYLLWSHLAPASYPAWRRWELSALHPAGRQRAAARGPVARPRAPGEVAAS